MAPNSAASTVPQYRQGPETSAREQKPDFRPTKPIVSGNAAQKGVFRGVFDGGLLNVPFSPLSSILPLFSGARVLRQLAEFLPSGDCMPVPASYRPETRKMAVEHLGYPFRASADDGFPGVFRAFLRAITGVPKWRICLKTR